MKRSAEYNDLRVAIHVAAARTINVYELLQPHDGTRRDKAEPSPDGVSRAMDAVREQWGAPQCEPSRPNLHRVVSAMWSHPVVQVLETLPHRQAAVCGLLAAEGVLEDWYGLADHRQVRPSIKLAPRIAIRNAWRWFRGEYRLTDLADCVENVVDAAGTIGVHVQRVDFAGASWVPGPTGASAAVLSACYASAAAVFARGEGERDSKSRVWRSGRFTPAKLAGKAVIAAVLVRHPSINEPGALAAIDAWWHRCRARLAFRDAETAHIE